MKGKQNKKKNKQTKTANSMEYFWNAGQYQEAEKIALNRVQTKVDDVDAWKVIGVARAQRNSLNEAVEPLQRASKINPKDPEIFRSLGKVYWNLNQPQNALDAYKHCLNLSPTWFEALTELLQLCARMDRRDISTAYLDRAIDEEPNRIEFLYYAGIVNKERGAPDAAIYYLNKLIELQPDHLLAYNELGLCEYARQNNYAAGQYFKKANSIDPSHATPYYNHGIVLLENTEYKKSCEHFAEAVECKPDHIDAQFGLIRTYERRNLMDAADEALLKAEEINGEHSKLHAIAARLALRRGKAEEALKRLKQINWDELDGVNYRETLFVSGDIYMRLNDVDNAMSAYLSANEAQRESKRAQEFNKRNFLTELEKASKKYSPEFVRTWPKPTQERIEQDPVFFVGFPRSGTTLLETVLDTHPKLWVLEEKPVVGNLMEQIRNRTGGYPDALNRLSRQDVNKLREFYYQERAKYITVEEDETIIDKLPLNSAHIGPLYRIFPGAKFIFSLRHPADSVLSCFMQHFRPNSAMNNFYSLEEGTYCYDVVLTLVKKYHELLPLNIATVPYEAMVADLEATVRPVLDFLGVGWHEDIRKYRDHAQDSGRINTPSYTQVTEPIYTRARYRWQKYKHHMEHVLPTLLSWAEWHGYVHHEDGSIDHPAGSVHQPEPAEHEYEGIPEEFWSEKAPGVGAMLESEMGTGPLVVEKINTMTLKNNMVRIECITYGPDGEEQVSGTMHIPANVAGEVVQSLTGAIQQLSQSQKQELREAV